MSTFPDQPTGMLGQLRSKLRRKMSERRKSNAKPERAYLRPRTLTLPLPDPTPGLRRVMQQITHSQLQSPLFKLPYELRIRIYEYLLGYRTIHVALEQLLPAQRGWDWRENPHGYCQGRNGSKTRKWQWWHCICHHHPDMAFVYDHCFDSPKDSSTTICEKDKSDCRLNTALLHTCRRA
jgi:hypothetical protein